MYAVCTSALATLSKIMLRDTWDASRRWLRSPWYFLAPPFLCGSLQFEQQFSFRTFPHRTTVSRKFGLPPHSLIHGEAFPDASVVVPFGCAVLVLRDSDERAKFKNRAVMMLFAHYSEDHPLFTYAVYSPRTKRLLHRQEMM